MRNGQGMRLTIELDTCTIMVWPDANTVLFVCKYSLESKKYNILQFCEILDKVALEKRLKKSA